MRLWIFAIIATLIACFIGYYRWRPLSAKVRINNAVFFVEVAANEPQKQKGLGDRSSLASDHGMLFPYDHKEQYNFWMREMRFPLDFIWIDGDRVADIGKRASAHRQQRSGDRGTQCTGQ